MSQHNEYVIQTEGLSKSYKGVQALKSLDLRVPKHSIFAFLGPNGAGKSTTIKLLLGLSKPTSGKGNILGHDIVSESTEIRRKIGYLAQDPRFYKEMTARETLRFVAKFFFAGPQKDIEDRVAETLKLVGLAEKADRPVGTFSGGERQRLGIAQAQVNYPDLLILDEPAAALDPMGRRDVLEVMEQLRKHTTIFYSTHILDDVQRVSDSVAILNSGELVAQAPIEELLAGTGSTIYTVTLRGNLGESLTKIEALPWVASVGVTNSTEVQKWQVSVNDEKLAEAQLLRQILSNPDITVTEYGRKRFELEEVFMQIVEGDKNGR